MQHNPNIDRFRWQRLVDHGSNQHGLTHEVFDTQNQRELYLRHLFTQEEAEQHKLLRDDLEVVLQQRHPAWLSAYGVHQLSLRWSVQQAPNERNEIIDPPSHYLLFEKPSGPRLDHFLQARLFAQQPPHARQDLLECRLENALSLDEIRNLHLSLLRAIIHAQQANFPHLQLSTARIFCKLDDKDQLISAQVADFGFRHASHLLSAPIFASAHASHFYAAPEQWHLLPDIPDSRSDLFALTVLTYQLLTGYHPFYHREEHLHYLRHHSAEYAPEQCLPTRYQRHLQGQANTLDYPLSIAQVRERIQRVSAEPFNYHIDNLLASMLALRPEQRPSQFDELLDQLSEPWQSGMTSLTQATLQSQDLLEQVRTRIQASDFQGAHLLLKQAPEAEADQPSRQAWQRLLNEYQALHSKLQRQQEMLDQAVQERSMMEQYLRDSLSPERSSAATATQSVESRFAFFLLGLLLLSGLFTFWSRQQYKHSDSPSPLPMGQAAQASRPTASLPPRQKPTKRPTKAIVPPAHRRMLSTPRITPRPPARRTDSTMNNGPQPPALRSQVILRVKKLRKGVCPPRYVKRCYFLCVRTDSLGRCLKQSPKRICRCLQFGTSKRNTQQLPSGPLRPKRPSRTVDVQLTTLQFRGPMSRTRLARRIQSRLRWLSYCYAKSLRRNPSLPPWDITYRFVIQHNGKGVGKASRIKMLSSQPTHPTEQRCLRWRLQRVSFPIPRGGGLVIVTRAQFKFQARKAQKNHSPRKESPTNPTSHRRKPKPLKP